jgi:N-dimethylarginine dimethylaminohydrolase
VDTYKVSYRYIDPTALHVDVVLHYIVEAYNVINASEIAQKYLEKDIDTLYDKEWIEESGYLDSRVWRCTVSKTR